VTPPAAAARPLRILLGAFGDPGHAFPMLALGERLVARGHAVALQTWRRWQAPAEAAGMTFLAAPEYQVWPTRERPLAPYAAAVRAAHETVPAVEAFAPDVAVADVLTVAPALAAEVCGVPVATLVPHVHPWQPPGCPPFSIGARRPRTRLGGLAWRAFDPAVRRGLELGRTQHNEARRRLGLGPLPYHHTGLSRSLTLVATLPQLEYPRRWPAWLRVVGPLLQELLVIAARDGLDLGCFRGKQRADGRPVPIDGPDTEVGRRRGHCANEVHAIDVRHERVVMVLVRG